MVHSQSSNFIVHSSDSEFAIDEFANIADFLLEAIVFDVFIGEEHAEAVFAEPFLGHSLVEQQFLKVGVLVSVLFYFHNHQFGDICHTVI